MVYMISTRFEMPGEGDVATQADLDLGVRMRKSINNTIQNITATPALIGAM